MGGGKVTGKGVGEALCCGQVGAVGTRAQDVEGHFGPFCNGGPYLGFFVVGREVGLYFGDFGGKGVSGLHKVGTDGLGRLRIGSRCPAQSQFNASRIQLGQGAELFGYDQGRVVGGMTAPGATLLRWVLAATLPIRTEVALVPMCSALWFA